MHRIFADPKAELGSNWITLWLYNGSFCMRLASSQYRIVHSHLRFDSGATTFTTKSPGIDCLRGIAGALRENASFRS